MTIKPSRAEFHELAREHTVVPVWREVLGDLTTPVSAFLRVVGDEPGFLLESVEHERWGRWSFIGRRPVATLIARGVHIETEGMLAADVPLDRGVLAAVEAVLAHYRSPSLPELPPLHGGLVGYVGYDVVREAYYACDGDTLLFVVEQEGRGACHTGERTCFYRSFGE